MAALTATPDATTATIAIRIIDPAGVTGILRSDANGTRLVRLRTGDLPTAAEVTVTDHEAALSGHIQYRAQGAAGEAWTSLGVELPRFTVPSSPTLSIAVENVHGYSGSRRSRSIFHEVIGRPDPAVSERELAPRTGKLDAWLPDYPAAKDLEDLLSRGKVIMYRQAEHAGLDMYFHAGNVDVVPDEGSWRLSVDYIEVGHPAGMLPAAAAWTFGHLTKAAASFDAVPGKFDSFHDVTINEQSS